MKKQYKTLFHRTGKISEHLKIEEGRGFYC